ncbi:hypothetical protein PAECIP111891_05218 [Paenibacillus allorhizoplanae]|uniref:Penicillin-binding protein dimerisation domain-containing protein n=2 Tax=Paenibacillus allorhizoplanae TaxID=2905648 RepID=A0ABN8GXM5_9BACL|nr:hypothetical protein PAECIP111891_05218 [Paenibacillus allorhizoplanae]
MDIKGRTHLPFQQRRIKLGLSKEEIAYLWEHRDEYPGMEIVEERIRHYSPDRVAAQLVGYVSKMKGAKSQYIRRTAACALNCTQLLNTTNNWGAVQITGMAVLS